MKLFDTSQTWYGEDRSSLKYHLIHAKQLLMVKTPEQHEMLWFFPNEKKPLIKTKRWKGEITCYVLTLSRSQQLLTPIMMVHGVVSSCPASQLLFTRFQVDAAGYFDVDCQYIQWKDTHVSARLHTSSKISSDSRMDCWHFSQLCKHLKCLLKACQILIWTTTCKGRG